DRRRTGGADHRNLRDLRQYQPLRGLFPPRRRPPRTDRNRRSRADDRARRLWLYAAHQCRRGVRDRQHADIERAAAPALKRRDVRIGDTGLGVGAVGYGVVVGGTSGSGVILLSLLMACGLEGAAVIATDAVISIV